MCLFRILSVPRWFAFAALISRTVWLQHLQAASLELMMARPGGRLGAQRLILKRTREPQWMCSPGTLHTADDWEIFGDEASDEGVSVGAVIRG